MSVPKSLFIDTSIFDEQNYNFDSAKFLPFLAAVGGKNLTFLLPDPTSREIRRHIAEPADNVVNALEDARRKAPFLAKSKNWPIPGFALSWELKQLATDEWKQFLKNFVIKELSFEGVNLTEIMNWYDKQDPPFGPKKSKEFPDALAIGSLLTFARKSGEPIAVISRDGDFKSACSRFAELLYFHSLAAFTEALIASDERVHQLKSLLKDNSHLLEDAIKKEFTSLNFYPAADPRGDVHDVVIEDFQFHDLRVVGVGVEQCTISFEASVDYTAYVQYDDPDPAVIDSSEDIYMPLTQYAGVVSDDAIVTGIAKIETNPNWTAFKEIGFLRLEEVDIGIQARPSRVRIK